LSASAELLVNNLPHSASVLYDNSTYNIHRDLTQTDGVSGLMRCTSVLSVSVFESDNAMTCTGSWLTHISMRLHSYTHTHTVSLQQTTQHHNCRVVGICRWSQWGGGGRDGVAV